MIFNSKDSVNMTERARSEIIQRASQNISRELVFALTSVYALTDAKTPDETLRNIESIIEAWYRIEDILGEHIMKIGDCQFALALNLHSRVAPFLDFDGRVFLLSSEET